MPLSHCATYLFQLKHFFPKVLSDSLVSALTTFTFPAYGSVLYLYHSIQLDNFALATWPAMHPFGLITLLEFLWEHSIPSLSIIALGLLLTVVFLYRGDQSSQDAPVTLPQFSLSLITSALNRRHDFFAWGFKITKQRLYQFRILRVCQSSVVLVALTFIDGDDLPVWI